MTMIVAPCVLSSPQQLEDLLSGMTVEVAGRLVRQHDRRLPDKRAGDRDPLALPAGHGCRTGVLALSKPNRIEGPGRQLTPLTDLRSGVQQPVRDVVEHGLVLGQEELLEDEPDTPGPQRCELAIVQAGDVDPVDPDRTAGRPVERADDVQQRRLAGPGRANDRHKLTLLDGETHATQSRYWRLGAVCLGDLVQLQYGWAGVFAPVRWPPDTGRSVCRGASALWGMSAGCSYVGHHDPLAGLHISGDLHGPGGVVERPEGDSYELVNSVRSDGLDRIAA